MSSSLARMNFFKRLFSSFSPSQDANRYLVTVQCLRCGEIIQTRVNLSNDLSLEDGEGNTATYFCRKVLIGAQRCFQKVEVELRFNANRQVTDRQITGGKFVERS
jgi:hypothetical protein